jgi:glycosylphosphatidylinositol transamidase (GPIT) subunit GPI8
MYYEDKSIRTMKMIPYVMAWTLQHHEDPDIGLAVIDRMTHELLEIFEAETQATSTALPQVVRYHG